MEAESNSSSGDEDGDYAKCTMKDVCRIQDWPGVNSTQTKHIQQISALRRVSKNQKDSKHVNVRIGKTKVELFTDTGSEFTIIPPDMYREDMGEIKAADTNLRAWGSRSNLDVKGMVKTLITTEKGATTETKVFIVKGYHPKPLLGAKDAQTLGFITFNTDGKDPAQESAPLNRVFNHNIPEKLRKSLDVNIETTPPSTVEMSRKVQKRYSNSSTVIKV